MNLYAVIGLQFGDEGKGSFTQHLSILNHNKDRKNLIVRFNGGHQAGHTVVYNKTRHIFSSFGSGTLVNEPTFWSKNCTVFPPALFNEYHVLKEKGITPKIIFDPLCPVTTPYDVISNKQTNGKTKHGSTGVGFGATIKRQEDYYKLYYQDLFNRTIAEAKMSAIKNYYENIYGEINIDDEVDIWFKCVDALIEDGLITQEKLAIYTNGLENYDNIIFEGAQGILLDMDFGFFPNVTRSNTTTANIRDLILDLGLGFGVGEQLKTFYITRTYQTRHGNGFMTNEHLSPKLINTKNETNLDTSYQGKFRKSLLDLDLIKYAIQCDSNFGGEYEKKSIVITCVDQLPDGVISFTKNKEVFTKHIEEFKEIIKKEFGYDVYISSEEGVFDYKGDPTNQLSAQGYYGKFQLLGPVGSVGNTGTTGTHTQGRQGNTLRYTDGIGIEYASSAKIKLSTKKSVNTGKYRHPKYTRHR